MWLWKDQNSLGSLFCSDPVTTFLDFKVPILFCTILLGKIPSPTTVFLNISFFPIVYLIILFYIYYFIYLSLSGFNFNFLFILFFCVFLAN